MDIVNYAKQEKTSMCLALLGNAAEILPELVGRSIIPDVVTDQTSAHDPLNGYYPAGLSKDEAEQLRKSDSAKYLDMAGKSIMTHVKAMIDMGSRGAVVFEHGHYIRQKAFDAGLKEAFEFPGFVQRYIRAMFCEG